MFFKKFKSIILVFLLSFIIIPFSVTAYSDYIIVSGENIGIRLNSKGIMIVGTYKIENENPALKAGLKVGDVITSINDKNVENISSMLKEIHASRNTKIKIGFIRNNEKKETELNLYDDNGILKTGLYVKDSITGIGTLTYIDPNTKLFGALGHEITEATTGKILDITNGTIFDAIITGITPSNDGEPGEKNATFNTNSVDGEIIKNTNKGIFGKYTNEINETTKYKVAHINDIKLGDAELLTVLDSDKIGKYKIKILKVSNTQDKIKNIVFEIVDKDLLNKTNGIIQGMSGSPIIQGEFIIGAVTHVVVDNPHKGYGILITNMLEEGEKKDY